MTAAHEELQGLTIRQYYGTSELEKPLTSDSAIYLRAWAQRSVRPHLQRERRTPEPLMLPLSASYALWYASLPEYEQKAEQTRYGLTEDELLGRGR